MIGDYDLLIELDGECSVDTEFSGDMELLYELGGELGEFYFVRQGAVYTGVTDVIPKTHSQTLETAQKTVLDDIHVLSIPYYETANESGTTVYIADEV